MVDRELRKLSRKELLEMLIEQEKENERLRSRLSELQDAMQNREIAVNSSGSLAEAALKLNGVFDAADAAAKQYLENIRQCSEKQQQDYQQIIAEAKKEAAEILKDAEAEKQHIKQITRLLVSYSSKNKEN